MRKWIVFIAVLVAFAAILYRWLAGREERTVDTPKQVAPLSQVA